MESEMPAVSTALLTELGIKLITAIAIFYIGKWIARFVTNMARKAMSKTDMEDTLENFLGNIIYYTLMVAVIIAAINQLGVETTSLLAVVGAAGLAIGLALQGSLSNFASGVMIVLFRPYRVGDFIEAGGVAGSVEEVQIFTTIMKTPDNKKIIVPNSQIMAGEITNFSANPTRRVDLVAGCGYDDDLDKVRKVLEDIIGADDRILADPAPTIADLRTRRFERQFRRSPVGQFSRLLGRLFRRDGTDQEALRSGRHFHSVPAARRTRLQS